MTTDSFVLYLKAKTTNESISVIDLMPAEKSKQNDFHALNTSIINLHLILSIAEDALNEFLSFRYRSFDALLGNNSCYLVSYIIFKNAQRLKNDSTSVSYTHLTLPTNREV